MAGFDLRIDRKMDVAEISFNWDQEMAIVKRKSPDARRKALWLKQNGLCALCGLPLDYDEANLDHDHSCCNTPLWQACGNCDRGVLHQTCNTFLGHARDDIVYLQQAIDYLKRTDL